MAQTQIDRAFWAGGRADSVVMRVGSPKPRLGSSEVVGTRRPRWQGGCLGSRCFSPRTWRKFEEERAHSLSSNGQLQREGRQTETSVCLERKDSPLYRLLCDCQILEGLETENIPLTCTQQWLLSQATPGVSSVLHSSSFGFPPYARPGLCWKCIEGKLGVGMSHEVLSKIVFFTVLNHILFIASH